MWRELPPAGDPITLERDTSALPVFAGYRPIWLASGTAALALALRLAKAGQPHLDQPEVVLPAYGCPDLVSAAVFAGVMPVLADVGSADPAYAQESLQAALTPKTVAVVAVNFLGIRDRLPELRAFLAGTPRVLLVEDNAQHCPTPEVALDGDFVCLSFGRGKPVSLLGGGALLVRNELAMPDCVSPEAFIKDEVCRDRSLYLRIRIYNFLLHPWSYGLVSRNPLFPLGTTTYSPLQAIKPMSSRAREILPVNFRRYLARSQSQQLQLQGMLDPEIDLAGQLASRCGRLLRYPVLCADRDERDRLLMKLKAAGLGATSLYRHALPNIDGVRSLVRLAGRYEGARAFADRLLTLPLHSGVTATDMQRMREILQTR